MNKQRREAIPFKRKLGEPAWCSTFRQWIVPLKRARSAGPLSISTLSLGSALTCRPVPCASMPEDALPTIIDAIRKAGFASEPVKPGKPVGKGAALFPRYPCSCDGARSGVGCRAPGLPDARSASSQDGGMGWRPWRS
jgi:hypothetical protein